MMTPGVRDIVQDVIVMSYDAVVISTTSERHRDVSVQCVYTSLRICHMIMGLCLVPGTMQRQMPCPVTQRGNALYCLIMCLQIAREHNCFTN